VHHDTGTAGGRLRFAIVAFGHTIAAWQAEALRRVPADLAHVVLRVEVTPPVDRRPPGAGTLLESLDDLYRRRRVARPGRALEQRPLTTVAAGAATVRGTLERTATGRLRLPDDVVEQFRDHACDVALNCTGQQLDGVPPSTLCHGVWEQRVTTADGRPDGDLASAGGLRPRLLHAALVRLAPPGGGGDVLLQDGWLHSVPHSVAGTFDAIHGTTVEWLARTCREVVRWGGVPVRDGVAPQRDDARDGALVTAALRSPLRRLQRLVQAPFWQEDWHIGIVDATVEELFRGGRLGPTRWLDGPSRRYYLADPFALDGDQTILAEAYDHLTRRGHIAAVQANGTGPPVARPVIDAGGHMSYPQLIRSDGEVYCLPETCDQRRATLYRAVRYPDLWEPVAVLVDDFAATDATVFRHDGGWWLLCTDDELGSLTNLHVFHADELTGPWTPHLLNPVKIDVRSSRPAGPPFVVDGRLIRPAQDGSHGYGSAVVFNEITDLSADTFAETPVGRLDPPAHGPYRHGLHTVSPWGDRTLVDGKRKGLSVMNLLGRTRRVVGRTERSAGRR